MKTPVIMAIAAALLASPVAALAKGPPGGVPPGLASKPGQMPPGQYKKLYQRGERLPLSYLSSQYYISQPSRYNLPAAPYGYRWVLVEDHAYLANTQTGLIANVIASLLR
jgi:hypothetical protein